MRPYFYLGGALAVVALLFVAFRYGVGVGHAERDAATLRGVAKLEAAARRLQTAEEARRALTAVLDARSDTLVKEIYREVPTVIDRPVYRNICIDADGVRLADRARDAANGADRTAPADRAAGSADDAPPR